MRNISTEPWQICKMQSWAVPASAVYHHIVCVEQIISSPPANLLLLAALCSFEIFYMIQCTRQINFCIRPILQPWRYAQLCKAHMCLQDNVRRMNDLALARNALQSVQLTLPPLPSVTGSDWQLRPVAFALPDSTGHCETLQHLDAVRKRSQGSANCHAVLFVASGCVCDLRRGRYNLQASPSQRFWSKLVALLTGESGGD